MRIWKFAIVALFVVFLSPGTDFDWYVFRPEGLYFDHRVQEEFP